MSTSPETVTMVKDGIHNPADARHFMQIQETDDLITATLQDQQLARSNRALKVKEVGYDIYDPVIYFPREDVEMSVLMQNSKTTHCPLKGDTAYFDFKCETKAQQNIAWSYTQPIPIAEALRDYIAFDARHVKIAHHGVKE